MAVARMRMAIVLEVCRRVAVVVEGIVGTERVRIEVGLMKRDREALVAVFGSFGSILVLPC
jgi:hypothetical protein